MTSRRSTIQGPRPTPSPHLYAGILKIGTLTLLAVLLFTLGSFTYHPSLSVYLSFFAMILLQALEVLFPPLPEVEPGHNPSPWRLRILRVSILLQLVLASVLVTGTGGSGSIYELVYLLPIVSAATRLPGREVATVIVGAVVAMIGFAITGEELTASIARVKAFQDAVAAMVYFTMAGILIYFFSQAERDQRLHYQTMATTLADTNAELRRVQAELTDRLAQLAHMEERIQRISQMAALGELTAQVAHEVRNPLGIIRGATEMLAARVSDPATHRHIAVLLEEVDRLNKAVDSILRLGAPIRFQTTRLDLHDLLRAVSQTVMAGADLEQYSVRLPARAAPIRIEGDRELLHHALANLIRNAFQAMPTGGVVTVETVASSSGDPCVLRISDTGSGLSPDDLKRLGEPFFTRRPGGVGLGFSLARRIITEHGGTLEVSSSLGHGTCVTIRLPAERGGHAATVPRNLSITAS
jgi:signal transduction histidine kinase